MWHGGGGIKPCVSALGGDQFVLPKQTKHMARDFSIFYLVLNAGALLSSAITPILRAIVHYSNRIFIHWHLAFRPFYCSSRIEKFDEFFLKTLKSHLHVVCFCVVTLFEMNKLKIGSAILFEMKFCVATATNITNCLNVSV